MIDETEAVLSAYNTEVGKLYGMLLQAYIDLQGGDAKARFALGLKLAKQARDEALRIIEENQ